jgi:hypothetical protein
MKTEILNPGKRILPVLMIALMLTLAIGCSDGTKSNIDGKDIEWLFVQNAESVSLDNGVLKLMGVSPTTVFFSDRPERLAAHGLTTEFVTYWSKGGGSDSFKKDPPNATLSIVTEETVDDVVLTLSNPRLAGNTLSYDVDVIDGREQLAGGPTSLFIDIVGMPLTPVSVAGVHRRAVRRAIY